MAVYRHPKYNFADNRKNIAAAIFLLITLFLLMAQAANAQAAPLTPPTQVVKKFVGEVTTFSFDFPVADEAEITHFALKWTDDLTKTEIVLKTIPKNVRTTSINAAFTPGFKFTYYVVTTVDNRAPTAVIESLNSNTVATERIGKPVTNLRHP